MDGYGKVPGLHSQGGFVKKISTCLYLQVNQHEAFSFKVMAGSIDYMSTYFDYPFPLKKLGIIIFDIYRSQMCYKMGGVSARTPLASLREFSRKTGKFLGWIATSSTVDFRVSVLSGSCLLVKL